MSANGNESAMGFDGESPRPWRRGRWALAAVAALAIAGSSAVGIMVVTAGTALAPEPVVTTQPLSGYNGATGSVIYPNSGTRGIDIEWSNSASYAPWLAIGTPCSLTALAAGAPVYLVIQGTGGYRWCGTLKWSNTGVYAPWLPAGTPCELTVLPPDQNPYMWIGASGPMRACVT